MFRVERIRSLFAKEDHTHRLEKGLNDLELQDGSRVGVIGGGPAGSFFSYFLLEMAERIDLDLKVDVYESRDFSGSGPAACNHCGGIISESLVQLLATEGINLPTTVVQRGIDSYMLHTDEGSVRIETPLHEKRIAGIYRGGGPRGNRETRWSSFDAFLSHLAEQRGARVVHDRVSGVAWNEGRPVIKTRSGVEERYDLCVGAVGVNSTGLRLFEGLDFGFQPPGTAKTYICELALGEKMVGRLMGTSMHVFLLDLPHLEFAAIIPKGEYATLCLLGDEIDKDLVQKFLETPAVKSCLPTGWQTLADQCHCSPRICVEGAIKPYTNRVVLVGDCGISRLYKDGIGAAYRTAKAAAVTAALQGISAEDFRRHYEPTYRSIASDNALGRIIFAITRQIQKRTFARRAILRMVAGEQKKEGGTRRMSGVLWDTFTGSAPYRDVLQRAIRPNFVSRVLWNTAASLWPQKAG